MLYFCLVIFNVLLFSDFEGDFDCDFDIVQKPPKTTQNHLKISQNLPKPPQNHPKPPQNRPNPLKTTSKAFKTTSKSPKPAQIHIKITIDITFKITKQKYIKHH